MKRERERTFIYQARHERKRNGRKTVVGRTVVERSSNGRGTVVQVDEPAFSFSLPFVSLFPSRSIEARTLAAYKSSSDNDNEKEFWERTFVGHVLICIILVISDANDLYFC